MVTAGMVMLIRAANPGGITPATGRAGVRGGGFAAGACALSGSCAGWAFLGGWALAGPGVGAEQEVQEGLGPELVQGAVQARFAEFLGPCRHPLVGGEDVGGGQFPAGQAGVAGVLGPAFHPGPLGHMLAPLFGVAGADVHHGPADRGPQPGRGQRPGPAHDHRLRGPRLSRDPAARSRSR